MPGKVWEQAMEVAIDHHGFVTFDDLRRLGADPALLRQWYQRSRVTRAAHGIYRFAQVAVTPLDDRSSAGNMGSAGRG